ncbi:uncharacterized protein BKA78DRAFT_297601 [Phyllosticta capitalensis]|uniref:uncharacterized protein n=1 Tax=Phyllosticta capitalensis TaxID=121624 RepID=UPI00313271B3
MPKRPGKSSQEKVQVSPDDPSPIERIVLAKKHSLQTPAEMPTDAIYMTMSLYRKLHPVTMDSSISAGMGIRSRACPRMTRRRAARGAFSLNPERESELSRCPTGSGVGGWKRERFSRVSELAGKGSMSKAFTSSSTLHQPGDMRAKVTSSIPVRTKRRLRIISATARLTVAMGPR